MNNDVLYFEHPFLETSVIAKTNHLILVQFCPKNRKNSDIKTNLRKNWTKIKRLDRAILYIQSEFTSNKIYIA